MPHKSTRSPSDYQVGFFIALCYVHVLFALPASASVECTGRVYDGEGNSVRSALITFSPAPVPELTQLAYSDSTGIYRLSLPDSSSGYVRVQALGYKPLDQYIHLGLESNVLDFRLELQPLLMDELVVQRRRSNDDASFEIQATGTSVFYQWFLDKKSIAGAESNTLII